LLALFLTFSLHDHILGKPKFHDARTTIFRKADEVVYNLKMKASRMFYFEAHTKFGAMPFSLRHFDDEIKAKIGSTESVKHGLLQPYEVSDSDSICRIIYLL